jgi:integrase
LDEHIMRMDPKKWLFESKPYEYMTNLHYYFNNMSQDLGFRVNPKYFRNTFTTLLLNESRCPAHITELLTNHQITNIIFQHYNKYGYKERKKHYDEYFPPTLRRVLDYALSL